MYKKDFVMFLFSSMSFFYNRESGSAFNQQAFHRKWAIVK